MRRFLVLLLITVIAVNVSAAALAAAAPSGQPPVGDHVYALMEELGKRGIIDVSSLSLKGDKRATRWNLVSAIAECLRTLDPGKLDRQDIEALRLLVAEFKSELDALGADYKALDAAAAPAPTALPDFMPMTLGQSASSGYPPIIHSFGPDGTFSAREPQETARYANYDDNPVKLAARDPLSTFSLDVNTTSYANVRRFLNAGRLPNVDAVRVEELINYFPASAADMTPKQLPGSPFSVACELAPCPWNGNNTLLWVSLTAKGLDYKEAPPANMVFLVDVSGSMSPPERLPLVKSSLKMLVEKLRASDRISLVTYAGSTALVLEATPGSQKAKILSAIDRLGAGGSTAGAAGLALAYEQARNAFIKGGINRILLCTDGDFNVGVSNINELEAMVKRERESGVTLSILGFGTDNYNDEMMTKISSAGNGNYGYVDSLSEARKILDEEMTSTFVTVAKDVKAQIEFNPANVIEYRQLGYEKRQLRNEDFNNDAVDAGEVGAGRRVIILYELTLKGGKPSVDPLRYQPSQASSEDFTVTDMKQDELAYLKFRWKEALGDQSEKDSSKAEMPILKKALARSFDAAGTGLRFSAAVAAYGQKLRGNPNLAGTEWKQIKSWAQGAQGDDQYRAEFLKLVDLAGSISGQKTQ